MNIRRGGPLRATCLRGCQSQTYVNFLPGMRKVALLRLRGQQPIKALRWHWCKPKLSHRTLYTVLPMRPNWWPQFQMTRKSVKALWQHPE